MVIKNILFDLDGVLFDGSDFHKKIFLKALKDFKNIELSDEFHNIELEALTTKQKLAKLFLKNKIKECDIENIYNLKQKYTVEQLNDYIIPSTIQKDLIQKLSSEFKLFCVSNSIRQTVETCLKRLEIYEYFTGIISNEDTSEPKPSPKPYLTAFEKWNLIPNESLILEDSQIGLDSAYSSGAYVFHVKNMNDITYETICKPKLNLLMYSNGSPFDEVKKLTIETIRNFTNYTVIIHDYNLEKIRKKEWFKQISSLPQHFSHKRDGYYNIWKAFLTKDILEKMDEKDILYYIDSSKYFMIGFTENLDKMLSYVNKFGSVAGSIGRDICNNSFECCDNILVWDTILPNNNNINLLNYPTVLNSWFLFLKNEETINFVKDWVFFCTFKNHSLSYELATIHHTVDQSIFNILLHKHKLRIFFKQDILHCDNKNKNLVLNVVNNTPELELNNFFIRF